jgi:hypothetical protein
LDAEWLEASAGCDPVTRRRRVACFHVTRAGTFTSAYVI